MAYAWGGLLGLLMVGLWAGGGSPLGVWQFALAAATAETAGLVVLWRVRAGAHKHKSHFWLPPSAPFVPVAAFAVLTATLGLALGFWADALAVGLLALAAVLLQRHLKQRPPAP